MTASMLLERVDYAVRDGAGSRPLLTSHSAQFAPGRFACLTGPSGCGKTTILSLLAGICQPDAGLVRHGEVALSELSDAGRIDWRRQHLGLVFQTCRLIDVLDIAGHIEMVARLRGRPAIVADGLARIAALGLADRLAQRPAQLSGGEKQRVALALALCAAPAVVLADEPTAALDRENARLVAELLADFARCSNAVVVAVSHDPIMIEAADDVVHLQPPGAALQPAVPVINCVLQSSTLFERFENADSC